MIYAITARGKTAAQTLVSRGTLPILVDSMAGTEELIHDALDQARALALSARATSLSSLPVPSRASQALPTCSRSSTSTKSIKPQLSLSLLFLPLLSQ
jgi:hypothetical protein